MTKASQFLSFDGRQEELFCANKYCCHHSRVFVGIVLHVGEVSLDLVFTGLYPALCVRVKRPGLAAVQKDVDYVKLEEPLHGGRKLMELLIHSLLSLAHRFGFYGDSYFWTAAVLVPFLERFAPKHLKPVISSNILTFTLKSAL
ncbi:hypothetical protein DPMN_041350 [Dreissena polymorpha]|uniref:Uncharacterized protein n=1 Tax=Dreissena polymorpha TaxID=45954 RepID=A0A9D4CZ94_DREPO|nr:hypothetical protein DPMN_041350 [Dreissena polymorpha]